MIRFSRLAVGALFFLAANAGLAQTIAESPPPSPVDSSQTTERKTLFQIDLGGGISLPNRAPVQENAGYFGRLGFALERDPGYNMTPDLNREVTASGGWTWQVGGAGRISPDADELSEIVGEANFGRYLLLNSFWDPVTCLKFSVGARSGLLRLPEVSVVSHLYQEFRDGTDPQLDQIVVQNDFEPFLQATATAELIALYTVKEQRVMSRFRFQYGYPVWGDYTVQSSATPANVVQLTPSILSFYAAEMSFGIPGKGIEIAAGASNRLALRTQDGLNVERIFMMEGRLSFLLGGWRNIEL
ncbi:MAG: hypothetical protein AAGN35_19245 [Bacteroidota bacterium]